MSFVEHPSCVIVNDKLVFTALVLPNQHDDCPPHFRNSNGHVGHHSCTPVLCFCYGSAPPFTLILTFTILFFVLFRILIFPRINCTLYNIPAPICIKQRSSRLVFTCTSVKSTRAVRQLAYYELHRDRRSMSHPQSGYPTVALRQPKHKLVYNVALLQ